MFLLFFFFLKDHEFNEFQSNVAFNVHVPIDIKGEIFQIYLCSYNKFFDIILQISNRLMKNINR